MTADSRKRRLETGSILDRSPEIIEASCLLMTRKSYRGRKIIEKLNGADRPYIGWIILVKNRPIL